MGKYPEIEEKMEKRINGNIILTCLQCKKSKAIETTEETLTRLLNAKAIIIGK